MRKNRVARTGYRVGTNCGGNVTVNNSVLRAPSARQFRVSDLVDSKHFAWSDHYMLWFGGCRRECSSASRRFRCEERLYGVSLWREGWAQSEEEPRPRERGRASRRAGLWALLVGGTGLPCGGRPDNGTAWLRWFETPTQYRLAIYSGGIR